MLVDLLGGGTDAGTSVVYGRPCVGNIAPTLGAWFAEDITPLPFDPEAAQALLEEAGWKDADGDGVRERDGKPLRFSVMAQTGSALMKRTAVVTQAYWKKIGVALDIDMMEPTRFAERAREKDFDAILWGYGANPKVDPSQEWRSDGQYNWFGYDNPQVDALIDEGVASPDLAASQRAFREVQRIVYADAPATFLFWEDGLIGLDSRFRDVEINSFNYISHAERWWVPVAQQRYP
jgi:peptide/nickel transport system substrate-binding protein